MSDMVPRPAGCRCHWEIGDSPCPVHPSEDDCTCSRIMAGTKPTGARNLRPECPVHGDEAKRREDELFARKEAKR